MMNPTGTTKDSCWIARNKKEFALINIGRAKVFYDLSTLWVELCQKFMNCVRGFIEQEIIFWQSPVCKFIVQKYTLISSRILVAWCFCWYDKLWRYGLIALANPDTIYRNQKQGSCFESGGNLQRFLDAFKLSLDRALLAADIHSAWIWWLRGVNKNYFW